MAKGKAECSESDDRNTEEEEPRHRVVQNPSRLAGCDGEQPRTTLGHERCSPQSVKTLIPGRNPGIGSVG